MCKETFLPQGTTVADPTNGDCKGEECDGMGGTVTVNDDNDTPPVDGNMCTTESCNNGVPMVTNDPVGSGCNGGVCNSMAMCVECVADGDCTDGTNPRCSQETCISCSDGTMNGDETGTDCGGSCPEKCNGETCAMGAECQSGFCADTVCCDTTCTGNCKSCNVTNSVGTCTNIPLGQTDTAPVCDGTMVCNGMGSCKLKDGENCNNDGACASGKCMGMPRTCQP